MEYTSFRVNKEVMPDLKYILHDRLIVHKRIDENYYEIIIDEVKTFLDLASDNYIVGVRYGKLIRECWNDLPECEERLKEGTINV